MKKFIMTALFFLTSRFLKGGGMGVFAESPLMKLTPLKMSIAYLRSIQTFRLLFISLLGIGGCLIFIVAGLVVLNVTLLTLTPWSQETKLFVGLGCAFFYLLIGFGVLAYIFSEEKWMKMFHADDVVKYLTGSDFSEDVLRKKESSKPKS